MWSRWTDEAVEASAEVVLMIVLKCSGQNPVLPADSHGWREQERVRRSATELQRGAVETFQQRHTTHLQGKSHCSYEFLTWLCSLVLIWTQIGRPDFIWNNRADRWGGFSFFFFFFTPMLKNAKLWLWLQFRGTGIRLRLFSVLMLQKQFTWKSKQRRSQKQEQQWPNNDRSKEKGKQNYGSTGMWEHLKCKYVNLKATMTSNTQCLYTSPAFCFCFFFIFHLKNVYLCLYYRSACQSTVCNLNHEIFISAVFLVSALHNKLTGYQFEL